MTKWLYTYFSHLMMTFLAPVTTVKTCEIGNDLWEYNELRAIKLLSFLVVRLFNPYNTFWVVHSLQTSNYQDKEDALSPWYYLFSITTVFSTLSIKYSGHRSFKEGKQKFLSIRSSIATGIRILLDINCLLIRKTLQTLIQKKKNLAFALFHSNKDKVNTHKPCFIRTPA